MDQTGVPRSWRLRTPWAQSGNVASVLPWFRAGLIAISAALIAFSGGMSRLLPYVIVLAVVAAIMSLPVRPLHRVGASATEWVAAVAIATAPVPAAGNLMLYLLAPGLALGLRGGARWTVSVALGASVLGLALIFRVPTDFDTASVIDLVQWSVLGAALGLMAEVYQRQKLAMIESPTRPYEEAVKALTELESISRRLPTGLDVATMSVQLLQEAIAAGHAEKGALATQSRLGQYDIVARLPESDTTWIDDASSLETWAHADSRDGIAVRDVNDGYQLTALLKVAERLVGLLVIRSSAPFSDSEVDEVRSVVERGAVPLHAAVLFSLVRDIATNEERSRVAREIHDGIAQDIAFLGYSVDEIVDLSDEPQLTELAKELRSEISRVVGDIRMSVFSLREQSTPAQTLGSALGDFTRRVLQDERIEVHMAIEESSRRLRPEIEAELRRIAQEAVTNVRRHAQAKNVWVTCTVDAPRARVTVGDDGVGVRQLRADSFGLEIMGERARRINAKLDVRHREGGGTVVEVSV